MLDSTKKPSIYGNRDFLELVWGNGQIHGGGGGGGSSNNRTQNTNSLSIGYSINPTSHKNEDDIHHVSTTTTTKRARLRSTSSNSLLDHHHHHFPSQTQKDSDIMTYSHHQSNNIGQVSSQSFKSTSPNEVFFPNLRPLKDSNHMSTYTSSQNYCFPSSSSSSSPNFKKPRIDSGQTRVVNFSNFSIPAMFLKSTTTTTHQNSATNIASSSARRVVEEIKSKTAVIETVQEQSITATKSDPAASLIEKSCAEVITNSEAVIREKRKLANTNPRAASTSVCSLEASNDPNFEEDTDDSTYFSDNEEETENNIVREKATHRGLKRFRNAEIHNLSERRRRDKINEKIRKLKELVPNCNKVDKASMLDDAIDYLKTLKLQLEIASMGRGLCMPPMMMLPPPPPPPPPHHMNAAQLMGFRPPQFTNNIIPAVLPPAGGGVGVTDNILQMFGFSNQIIPPAMPIPPNAAAAAASSPFINPMMMMIGNSSYTQQPPLIMETTNNLARHMANPAGQLTTQDYVHLSKLDRRD